MDVVVVQVVTYCRMYCQLQDSGNVAMECNKIFCIDLSETDVLFMFI